MKNIVNTKQNYFGQVDRIFIISFLKTKTYTRVGKMFARDQTQFLKSATILIKQNTELFR